MLTKAERHALATRVRLGERGEYGRWWVIARAEDGVSAHVYVLGVLVGRYHLASVAGERTWPANVAGERIWHCGYRHPRSRTIFLAEELLAYLERD